MCTVLLFYLPMSLCTLLLCVCNELIRSRLEIFIAFSNTWKCRNVWPHDEAKWPIDQSETSREAKKIFWMFLPTQTHIKEKHQTYGSFTEVNVGLYSTLTLFSSDGHQLVVSFVWYIRLFIKPVSTPAECAFSVSLFETKSIPFYLLTLHSGQKNEIHFNRVLWMIVMTMRKS